MGEGLGEDKPVYLLEKSGKLIFLTSSFLFLTTRKVPLITNYLTQRPELQPLQDHAPGHVGHVTQNTLLASGIIPIEWPANSPDMNTIETTWDKMKDWIDENYSEKDYANPPYPVLRRTVMETWIAISEETFWEQVRTMPERIKDLCDAKGGHTKW